ncbi:carboxypeptidase regulatory-like domain-containing protein, partial [candidate division KSB1 bacterium]|nr:carboxypeptidase regulatory-like domain-containing protein [candidate division KSB1 bacterium]
MVNYRKMIFSIIFIVSTTAVWLYAGGESPFFTQSSEKSSGLRGTITDSLSGTPLPARVVVENQNGEVINSHYNLLPGFFTLEDGSYEIDLMPGEYTVTVYHGIDYLSATKKVRIEPDAVSDISVRLEPWVPLRRLGWVNGDGHAHLYTDVENNEKMLAEVRRICRAQGVDFISTNQGWAGYDENNWRQGYAPFSDDRFLLHYGAEMPKYRTGHTWWLNIKSCHGYFDAAMDTMYENLYYQQESMPRWTFEKC